MTTNGNCTACLKFNAFKFDESVLELINLLIDQSNHDNPKTIAFLNINSANLARNDPKFHHALDSFECIFPDGIGFRIACLIRGKTFVSNIPGTDLVPTFLSRTEISGARVFLLGHEPDSMNRVAAYFEQTYPSLVLAGHHHGFFAFEQDNAIIDLINQSQADILLIGMGTPKQEKWLSQYTHTLSPKLQITVGGLFQYWDGLLIRAPKIFRKLGLEWFCILCQQPHKWRRYLIDAPSYLFHSFRK